MLRLCKLLTSVKILLFSTREFLCHLQSTETYASVNSSCAQLPSPPPSNPRATAGHLPAFLVWVGGGGGGVVICKFCAARGPGICQPRGNLRKIADRVAHLSRTGGCKGMFSILCMQFFIAYQARIT